MGSPRILWPMIHIINCTIVCNIIVYTEIKLSFTRFIYVYCKQLQCITITQHRSIAAHIFPYNERNFYCVSIPRSLSGWIILYWIIVARGKLLSQNNHSQWHNSYFLTQIGIICCCFKNWYRYTALTLRSSEIWL